MLELLLSDRPENVVGVSIVGETGGRGAAREAVTSSAV